MTHPVTEGPPAAPTRYTLRIPSTWWYLDLDPATRDASIRRRILSQVHEGTGLTREQIDGLVRRTRHTAREAHARGALQAAGTVRFPGRGMLLSATCVVVRIPVPEDESADLADVVLSAGVHVGGRREGGNPPGSVEFTELEHAGPAGRIALVEDVDHRGTSLRTALLHTLVPIPHSRDYLVLSGSTPNVELKDQFFAIFDAIADTLRFEEASTGTGGPTAASAGPRPQGTDENGK